MNRHYLNRTGFNKLAQSIKDYINRKITGYDKLGTASTKDFTTYVSPTQTDQLPISSSVYSAMTNMLRGAYHPAGSKTIAELTSDLLVKANLGNVYKITEDGVTSDLFIGGAGQTIKTGDNAVVLYASEDTYMFSLESGVVDLDAYQKKELVTAIEGANTVEDAISKNADDIADIQDVIPSDASANNKLVVARDNNFKYTDLGNPDAAIDANDLKETGVYSVYGQGGNKHFPFKGWNILYVTRANNSTSYVQQMCIDVQGTMYIRKEAGANYWTSWQKLVTTADLTSSVTSGSTAPITSGGVFDCIPVMQYELSNGKSITLDMGSTLYRKICIYNYNEYYEFVVHEWGATPRYHWIVGTALPPEITASYSSYRLTLVATKDYRIVITAPQGRSTVVQ